MILFETHAGFVHRLHVDIELLGLLHNYDTVPYDTAAVRPPKKVNWGIPASAE